MFAPDLDIVAPLVAEYYQWLSGHGGQSPEVLLARPLSKAQRRMLIARMDDVLVLWGITAPVRSARDRDDVHIPRQGRHSKERPSDRRDG